MFPPPITIATCTPSSVMDLMSKEYWESISGSSPKLLSPINDSPESLSRIRLYFGSMSRSQILDCRLQIANCCEDRETVLSLTFDDLVTSCCNSVRIPLCHSLVLLGRCWAY